MKKVKNYPRFFALIKTIPGDREELKENLVRAFTNGRTISIREMSAGEYDRMCDSLKESQTADLSQNDFTAEIKRQRSARVVGRKNFGHFCVLDVLCGYCLELFFCISSLILRLLYLAGLFVLIIFIADNQKVLVYNILRVIFPNRL
jgi:hypothetical protein